MAPKHGPDTLAGIHGTTEAVSDNLASWNDRADVHANGGQKYKKNCFIHII